MEDRPSKHTNYIYPQKLFAQRMSLKNVKYLPLLDDLNKIGKEVDYNTKRRIAVNWVNYQKLEIILQRRHCVLKYANVLISIKYQIQMHRCLTKNRELYCWMKFPMAVAQASCYLGPWNTKEEILLVIEFWRSNFVSGKNVSASRVSHRRKNWKFVYNEELIIIKIIYIS